MATKKNASSTESTEENAPSTESTEENASSAKKQNPLKDFTGNKTLLTLSGLMLLGLLGGLLSAFGVFTDLRAIVWSVSIWLMVGGAAVLAGAWFYGTWMSRQQQEAAGTSAKKLTKEDGTARRAMYVFLTATGVGLLFIVIFAIDSENFATFVSRSSVGVMIAGASMLVGGLLGFLFGIPRTLQQDRPTEPAQQTSPAADGAGKAANEAAQKPAYGVNTNLEQISDWLTKILVGVGLTQITVMPGKLWTLAESLGGGLGDAPGSAVLALAIIIFYSVSGFMGGYLWTRLYLAGAFRRADYESLVGKIEASQLSLAGKIEASQQAVAEQGRAMDLTSPKQEKAMELASLQLNVETSDIEQRDLDDAIKEASLIVRSLIFNEAHRQRSENWKEDQEKVKRTIPIFKALIVNDTEGKNHRYRAQLGYALKDQPKPDWKGAIDALTEACDLRDSGGVHGYVSYEYNRAVSRIGKDQEEREGQSSPETRNLIIEDLKIGTRWRVLRKALKKDKDINKWMEVNEVTLEDP